MALQNPIRYPWSEGADCFVYAPAAPGEHPGQQHPVLCFLHGRGEAATGEHPDGVAAHKSPAWHANNRSPLTARFLVVCPQRRDVVRWTDSDAGNFHLFLDEVIAEHNGDADQVFLTGFSLGGDAVFWFAHYDRGNRFQKLWAVDPAIQDQTPVPAPGRPVLLHHGVRMRDVVTRFQRRAGLLDWSTAGVPAGGRFVCDLGLPHVETCQEAYGDQRAYDWLLTP
jgi:predicted esterase